MYPKSKADMNNHSLDTLSNFPTIIGLIAITFAIFISFVMWQKHQLLQVNNTLQEYQINLVNRAFEDFPTAAGYSEEIEQIGIEIEDDTKLIDNSNSALLLTTNSDSNEGAYLENNIVEIGAAIQSAYSHDDSLFDVDRFANKNIDVTDVTYISSRGVIGNQTVTGIDITQLEYLGEVTYHDMAYLFLDNAELVASGFSRVDWNDNNAVLLTIKSPADLRSVSIASLYFRVKPLRDEMASVNLVINGEDNIIELSGNDDWIYIRADVDFQGDVKLELRPVGISDNNKLDFAGMTLL
ncbi:hypothetical protein [Psychromonas sp. MME2]|uniref:hypothetical protein n=1 Tax=unclassified Psychromonas TaxID=2614957 RepID=UPI00339BDA10